MRTGKGVVRRLTPIELERLNMFPDEHTKGASDARRAFFMGNALVTGIVRKVGEVLAARDGEQAPPQGGKRSVTRRR